MEDELRAICSELAKSIRRESDLEQIVSRLRERMFSLQNANKRSSEYSFDSGYSSKRASDNHRIEEDIERVRREYEVEKASIRLELGIKLQDEWSRSKDLERQIHSRGLDQCQTNNPKTINRVRDLETTCNDLRRRLAEEKQSNLNFEHLLGAIQDQLQEACDDRDILRERAVPRLCKKCFGTEASSCSSKSCEEIV